MSAILERQKGEKEFVCFVVFWAERRRTEKIIVMREKRRRWLFCLNPNPTPPKIKKKFLLMRGRLVSRSSFKFKISSEAGGKNKARVGSYRSLWKTRFPNPISPFLTDSYDFSKKNQTPLCGRPWCVVCQFLSTLTSFLTWRSLSLLTFFFFSPRRKLNNTCLKERKQVNHTSPHASDWQMWKC